MTDGPKRLLGDDPIDQSLLAAAREDAPPPDLESRILAGLVPPVPPHGGSGPSGATLGLKLGGGAMVAGVGIVAWLLLATPSTSNKPAAFTTAPSASEPVIVAGPAPPPTTPIATSAPDPVVTAPAASSAPAPAIAAPSARAHAPVASAPASASVAPPPVLGLAAEIQALDGARSAMNAGDQTRALAALDAYDRAFPGGTLAQEAALLRIDVLMRAGRAEEARRLGHSFLVANPSTPHRKRIQTLLRESE